MSIYQKFCNETFDQDGKLTGIELNYPENFNFGYDVVDAIAQETPEKRALVWCNTEGQERIFTFEDIRRLSNQTANALSAAGVHRGDRVIIVLKRHYEYWYVSIALHKLGAVMIPVTHMLTEEDICHRLRASHARAVICTAQDDVPERVQRAVQREAMDCLLWTVQAEVPGFRNLTVDVNAADVQLERRPTNAEDPMTIFFTSGTTGLPKGVVHNFAYPLAHIVTAKYWQQAEEDGLHFTVAETGWAKASWGKLYGQWLVGSAVMVFDFDNFNPKHLATIINRYGVTSFCAPPTVYRYLVRKGMPDMPSLRHASTAGEALDEEVFRQFTARTGLPLAEGYGQTETALLLGNFAGNTPVSGALGRPSPLVHIELQDADGTPTPQGEIGEIVILPPANSHIPGVFSTYLDDSGLYSEVWHNGVYHTGDAAWQDSDGVFWFHGRMDDVIKTGGFRVGPFEIENVLMQHPAVLECSVIGVEDPLRGQSIKAVIVLAPGHTPSRALEYEIRDFCNAKLADYKWIRSIDFIAELPKTISGKICRAELKKASMATMALPS